MADKDNEDLFLIDDPKETRPFLKLGEIASWLFPALGLLFFELFADPCLGVVIASLKFGYSDFRTAWWLSKHDPKSFRGTATSLCYYARGLFVVALTAFLIVLVIIGSEPLFRKNPLVNLESLLAGLVMWFLGVCLGTICAGVALHFISHHHIRVWMDSTIHDSRRKNLIPPVCSGRHNQFPWLCFAVATIVTICMLLTVISCVAAKSWEALISSTIILGIPSVWCLTGVVRSLPLAATSPEECWGESDRYA